MNCPKCGHELIWGGDEDAEDVFGGEEFSVISNYSCPECDTMVVVYFSKDTE